MVPLSYMCYFVSQVESLPFPFILGDFVISVFSVSFIDFKQRGLVIIGSGVEALTLLCLSRVGHSLSMKAN